MNKQHTSKYTLKYAAVQGSYWPAYCASCSFATVFLLSRNFNNSQIGMVLALGNVVSVLLQPAIASYADTTTKITLRKLTALLALVAAIMAVLIFFLPSQILILSFFFIIELALLFTLQPLTNSLGMQMINQGIPLNFGLARGIGSISFAAFSYIIGFFIDRFGADATIVIAFIMLLVFIFFTSTFSAEKYLNQSPDIEQKQKAEETTLGQPLGMIAFVIRYKRFIVLLLAVAVTFCSHMMINNYFIQIIENVNGNTKNMGTAIAIAAAVELPAMALFSYIVRKIRCSTILKLSFFFFVIKALLTLLAPNVWMIYIAQLLQFASYAFYIPASIYYVNVLIDKNDMVKGQAFMTGAVSLAGVVGSLLGGALLDGSGVRTMLIAGVLASILGLVLCLISVERTD